MKTFICLNCKSTFEDIPSKERLYCGPKCTYESKERRQKLRIASTGKYHSEETKNKMSKIKRKELHPLFGKQRSKKTKIRMNETRRRNILIQNTNLCINPVPIHYGERKGGIRHINCSYYEKCLDIVCELSTYLEDGLKARDKWKLGFSCIECNVLKGVR